MFILVESDFGGVQERGRVGRRNPRRFEVSQIRRRLEKLLAEVGIIAFGFIDSRRRNVAEGEETVKLPPLRPPPPPVMLSEHLNEIAMSYDV